MTANIWNHSQWIEITKKDELCIMFNDILAKSGFKILNFCEHHFTPQGYTALWLLGESHFALHTFPEFGKTYIELSSCNKNYFVNFLQLLEDKLEIWQTSRIYDRANIN